MARLILDHVLVTVHQRGEYAQIDSSRDRSGESAAEETKDLVPGIVGRGPETSAS